MPLNKEQKKKKAKNKKPSIFSLRHFVYDFIKITGALPMWLYTRPKIHYVGNKKEIKKLKRMLVMSNHISMLDAILLHFAFVNRRLWILALDSLFNTKFKNWFFTQINCIKIDRDNVNLSSYKDMVKYLEWDKAVCIFPEGKIEAKENELQQFKLGLTFIAIMNKTPIVPVFLKKRKNFFHRYHVLVGEPINLHEMCSKIPTIPEIEKAGQLLFEKEKELQTYFEENIERRIK